MNYPLIKPKYYFSLFKDIVQFIKRPHLQADNQKPTSIKIYDTIGLYLIKMVFLLPVLLFFALVYDPPNVQSTSMTERFSPIVFLLVGGFLLPLVEEVGFRLSLRFKPIYLVLSSSVFMYYFLTKAIFFTKISVVDESFWFRMIVSVGFGVVLFPILNTKSVKEQLTKFWEEHFRIIFYVTCLIFAWIHISKYEITLLNVLLLPILTLPQLMSAIIYGYIRISFGFRYPLCLHMLMNSITIGLSFLPFAD